MTPGPPSELAATRRADAGAGGLPTAVMVVVGLLALASLVAEFGFWIDAGVERRLEHLDVALALAFGLDLLVCLVRSRDRRRLLRGRWHEYVLFVLFAACAAAVASGGTEEATKDLLRILHLDSATKLYIALLQVWLLANVLIRLGRAHERTLELELRPEVLLVLSFALLCGLGTLLLWLPRAAADRGDPLGFVDATFTATSAACVTGLVVRDTGTELSLFGQTAVLFLIQVGGLGIITFVALGSVISGRQFSVPQSVALREIVNVGALSDVRRQVVAIFGAMLLMEAAGAVLLYACLPAGEPLPRAWWSLFHAVSAFCNAGFALQSDSLSAWSGSLGVNLVVVVLLVTGGLGFPVLRNLGARLARALRRGGPRRGPLPRFSVQAKLTLLTTAVLLAAGTAGFWLLEADGVLAGRPLPERALAALFQSATTRTAGFNTVPIDELGGATLVFFIGLMAIGAGAVSTGGGIKATTVAVLLLAVRSMARGRESVEAFGRTIPFRVVRAAVSVFLVYVVVAGTGIFGLALLEPSRPLSDLSFEAVSALSTVGLSTGITGELSTGSRLLLCALMFVGRVGPLTLTLSVLRARGGAQAWRYPEETLVVG